MVRSLRHFRGEAEARREALTKVAALRRRTGKSAGQLRTVLVEFRKRN
jgi:hypothetical protein